MTMSKLITLNQLEKVCHSLMEYTKKMIELHHEGQTNCPNCGAAITSDKCEYCGTEFMKWYEKKGVSV